MIPSKNPIWADKGRFCLYPAVVEGEQENKKYLIFCHPFEVACCVIVKIAKNGL